MNTPETITVHKTSKEQAGFFRMLASQYYVHKNANI